MERRSKTMDDFTLNDMIDFFSASGSGVNVVVMDDVVVLEKEKKEMKEKNEELPN